MKLILISSNEQKIKELRALLSPDVEVETRKFEYPELQLESSSEITKAAAKMLCERLRKTVVVEDSGFFVDALAGFPGTMTKHVHYTIGLVGMLKLMKGVRNRRCRYVSAIGLCEPGKPPLSFVGEEEGTVALRARGTKGWGQDPIFIPFGEKKTYGESGHPSGYHLFRKRAAEKLKDFIRRK
jgi:XTP/dITP diphosphohydrolase